MSENPHEDLRLFGSYFGVVVDREDPQGLARIRAEIAGVIDKSAWAWPIGSGGAGSAQRGAKWVPQVGAEVVVLFLQGDPDSPLYFPAHWGKPKGVTEIPGADIDPEAFNEDGSIDDSVELLSPAQAPDVPVFEFRDYQVVIDEREGKGLLLIRHKLTGDRVEHDGVGFGWSIKGTTAIRIVADGLVSIEGAQIQINGRMVANNPNPI